MRYQPYSGIDAGFCAPQDSAENPLCNPSATHLQPKSVVGGGAQRLSLALGGNPRTSQNHEEVSVVAVSVRPLGRGSLGGHGLRGGCAWRWERSTSPSLHAHRGISKAPSLPPSWGGTGVVEAGRPMDWRIGGQLPWPPRGGRQTPAASVIIRALVAPTPGPCRLQGLVGLAPNPPDHRQAGEWVGPPPAECLVQRQADK
jgi:hypothetical protein